MADQDGYHNDDNWNGGSEGSGGALRSIFLGNLHLGYTTDDVANIFEKPVIPPNAPEGFFQPIPVERIDVKRSYCFVFLKDAPNQEVKEKVIKFVSDINGM